ncbi:hypothetical protein HA402_009058 [Bradysia odoriphaga]|nr:hypothetical protein HA402_009058 [Bradysia odoriphaga]
MSYIFILMLCCIGCSIGASSDFFKYEHFHTSHADPPVYIEKMESVKIYTATWKLITRIELTTYENEHQRLEDEIVKLFKMCKDMGQTDVYPLHDLKVSCETSVKQMENIVDEIENTWKTYIVPKIQELQNTNLNLQMEDQNELEEIIKTSNTTQNYTTFIDGKRDSLTANASAKWEMELDVVNQKRNALINISNRGLSRDTRRYIMNALLQDLMSYSTITFLKYKVNQKNIYDALVTGKVLSTTLLLRELSKLQENVHTKKLDLPLSTDELSTKFYQHVSTKSFMLNKTVFFVYMLPLVEPTEFQSYQLQPYPRHIEESFFQLVLPDITRVALNKQQKRYFDMNTIDVRSCYNIENYVQLCELRTPVSSTENSGSCTVELLTQREVSNCKFRVMTLDHEIWFKLLKRNSWMFVLPRAIEISINCNGFTDQRFVKGAGILSVISTCFIRSDHLDIMAYAQDFQHKESVITSAEATINWSVIIHTIKVMNRNVTFNTLPKFISKDSYQLLQSASTSIDEVFIKK